jgi:hypothetical protein
MIKMDNLDLDLNVVQLRTSIYDNDSLKFHERLRSVSDSYFVLPKSLLCIAKIITWVI